jgi:hypothetical protein
MPASDAGGNRLNRWAFVADYDHRLDAHDTAPLAASPTWAAPRQIFD